MSRKGFTMHTQSLPLPAAALQDHPRLIMHAACMHACRYRGCWRWSVDGSVVLPCHISVDTCGPPDAASADLPAPDEGSPPSPQAFVGSILEQLQLAGVAGSVRFSDGRQPAESLRRRTLA